MVFPTMHNRSRDPRRKKKAGLHHRCSPDSAIHLPKGSNRSGSASHLVDARAELHRGVRNFFAARSEGNDSDDCCKNDSAFHSLLRWSLASQLVLTRYLSNRQVGASAEFQGTSLFTTASRQRNNSHQGRDHDHTFDVHGLLSYKSSAIASLRYRRETLRSRTQLLIQGFSTSLDAEMPRLLVRIGQPRTRNLETSTGPPMQTGRARVPEHTNAVKVA